MPTTHDDRRQRSGRAAVVENTDFAENNGSGARVMRAKTGAANLLPPRLGPDRTGDRFTVSLLFHHFVTRDAIDWPAHGPGANVTPDDVGARVGLREATMQSGSAVCRTGLLHFRRVKLTKRVRPVFPPDQTDLT